MQVGDKIYVYEIKLDFNNSKTEQICNIHKIIGVNEQKLVIDDYHFTVIKHKKAYSGDKEKLLNDVLFVDFTDWEYFGYLTGILRTTESDGKLGYRKVKKELGKYITKKLSRYGGAIELLDKIII